MPPLWSKRAIAPSPCSRSSHIRSSSPRPKALLLSRLLLTQKCQLQRPCLQSSLALGSAMRFGSNHTSKRSPIRSRSTRIASRPLALHPQSYACLLVIAHFQLLICTFYLSHQTPKCLPTLSTHAYSPSVARTPPTSPSLLLASHLGWSAASGIPPTSSSLPLSSHLGWSVAINNGSNKSITAPLYPSGLERRAPSLSKSNTALSVPLSVRTKATARRRRTRSRHPLQATTTTAAAARLPRPSHPATTTTPSGPQRTRGTRSSVGRRLQSRRMLLLDRDAAQPPLPSPMVPILPWSPFPKQNARQRHRALTHPQHLRSSRRNKRGAS